MQGYTWWGMLLDDLDKRVSKLNVIVVEMRVEDLHFW